MNLKNKKSAPAVGSTVVCVVSKSNAYKKGDFYTVTQKEGVVGLVGDDGLFDPYEMLMSGFKPVTDRETLKVVSDE